MSRRDTATPSLSALAFILRHRVLWPDGFVFDWWNCSSCAMALALKVWGREPGSRASVLAQAARLLRIPRADADKLFCLSLDSHQTPSADQIADRIDHYLGGK